MIQERECSVEKDLKLGNKYRLGENIIAATERQVQRTHSLSFSVSRRFSRSNRLNRLGLEERTPTTEKFYPCIFYANFVELCSKLSSVQVYAKCVLSQLQVEI